jgi:F0F1-type ATP synthase assembly protein I
VKYSRDGAKAPHPILLTALREGRVELLAGILVWGGLGWLADRWLGTDPWLLAIGIMLGFAGGMVLIGLKSKRTDDSLMTPGRRDGGETA